LLEALKTFLPATSRSVSKEHVVETLAKTYLSGGKVDKAVQVIRQHCHIRRLKGETAVVYALANILLGKHNEAENILEKIALERADRTGLHAVFLLGMSHLEQGKANEASVLFKNALRHRFKHDAMAKTYLYIGLTETEIEAGNKRNALMYCRKVSEIEAYKDYADKKREQIRKKH